MAYGRSALVTGGAGFIGSHLVDRLLDEGYRVIIVDDLSSGKLKNVNQRATFHHVSITQPTLLDVFNREKPDLVFHMAAQSSVSRSTRDPHPRHRGQRAGHPSAPRISETLGRRQG